MSFNEDDFQEGAGSRPEDIVSAARSCQAILILLLFMALLVCSALAVYLIN